MGVTFIDNRDQVKQKMEVVLDKTLEELGLYVEGQAKSLSPVGQYVGGRVGGRLRNSITHDSDLRSKKAIIGTNVEYSVYVEFGTRKMRSQKFLRPAAENNISTIERIVEENYKELNR